MKFRITKTAYAKLSEELRGEYTPADDKSDADATHYQLNVEGAPEPDDAAELRRARDREKERADNLKEELAEATGELTTLRSSQTTGEKDVAKTTARWQKKFDDMVEEKDGVITGLRDGIGQSALEAKALELASSWSTSPNVLLPHVTSKLVVEVGTDNKAVVKMKDKDGKPTDLKADDLKKVFVDNKDFAGIIRSTKASGGAATYGQTPHNPGGAGPGADPKVDLSSTAGRDALADRVRAKMGQGA